MTNPSVNFGLMLMSVTIVTGTLPAGFKLYSKLLIFYQLVVFTWMFI